ncbi:MAG: response regulator, partial [Candidatus Omnitrophica bacterium]|nr:response regulator [Candidatus Omnitrophota bacterium]
LIADDEAESRRHCRKLLESAGFQVLEASDGNEMVTLAQAHHPQLILADLLMPGMDGFEAVSELQKRPATASIPLLFLSTLQPQEALSQGVAAFLTKPFEREDLIEAVRQFVPASVHKPSVLVVDDERDIIDIVCDFLQDAGIQGVGCYDGKEALAALQRKKPDAIILDIKMPVLDGYGVIRFVKRHADFKRIPIIVLTATKVLRIDQKNPRPPVPVRTLPKPCDAEQMIEAVKKACA